MAEVWNSREKVERVKKEGGTGGLQAKTSPRIDTERLDVFQEEVKKRDWAKIRGIWQY